MPSIGINSRAHEYDVAPNECPICHYGMEPLQISGSLTRSSDLAATDTELRIAYRCARRQCGSMFIGYYRRNPGRSGQTFLLYATAPTTPVMPTTPPEVEKVSPAFVKIRGQAAAAEAAGLDEIGGVGYRKALEFLVKDFCIREHPEEAEEIKKTLLGTVIENFIDNQNIKSCAKLAAWLGNDETHYVRKWEEKDIRDLKILIDLTVSWIHSHVLTQQYMKDMGVT